MAVGQKKTFLTAHWGNLLLLNYAAPEGLLEKYLPPGCELDRFEGKPFLSLVAFQFTRTRVFGLRWPGYTNFPELNLRFYVKHGGRRGVCFVREFVPSALVAGIAKMVYNEPYAKARMSDRITSGAGRITAEYNLAYNGGRLRLFAEALAEPLLPPEGTLEHFFKEHDLGVGRDRAGRAVTYEVEHELWRVFPVLRHEVQLDACVYGPDFAFLCGARPASVLLAEGSEIVVYQKGK